MKQIILALFFCIPYLATAQLFTNVSQSHMPYGYTTIYSTDAKSGDFDNDGNIDLVVAADGQRNAIFFNNNGTLIRDTSRLLPRITTYQYVNGGEASQSVVVGDFDGDSDLDLIFVSSWSNYHEYLINDGLGNFTISNYQFPKSGNATSIVAADFNGDNHLDVVIGYDILDNALFLNTGNGTFYDATATFISYESNTVSKKTRDLTAADIDGDGDMDLLEAVSRVGCQIYINDNDTLKLNINLINYPNVGQFAPGAIDAIDIDNDGDLDIYLSNEEDNQQVLSKNGLFLNDGFANFTNHSQQLPFSYDFTPDAGFMDVNYDGYIDIIHTAHNEPQNYKAYINNPSNPGHFTIDNTIFPPISNSKGLCLHLADFNGDGKDDVYFGNTIVINGSTTPGHDQLIYSVLGVNTSSLADDLAINIFPNPTSDILIIEHNNEQELISIELLNTNGKLMLQQETSRLIQEVVDVSRFNTGVYVLKLNFLAGKSYNRKIVIR